MNIIICPDIYTHIRRQVKTHSVYVGLPETVVTQSEKFSSTLMYVDWFPID